MNLVAHAAETLYLTPKQRSESMSRGVKRLWLLIIGLIVMSNAVSYMINKVSIGNQYYYESESGNFQYVVIPSKGRDIRMMERRYEDGMNKGTFDREPIYRIIRIKPLNFWEWHELLNFNSDEFGYKVKYEFERAGET